jgi:ribonuclease VapC
LTEPTRRSLVVDTSAAVAVILGEPGSQELAAHLEAALVRLMSAAIRVELGIVIEARIWPAGQDIVDRFLRDAKVDIVPVDADLADRAMSSWRRYRKGGIQRGLILATASPTRSPTGPGTPYCAPATTSPRRISPSCAPGQS